MYDPEVIPEMLVLKPVPAAAPGLIVQLPAGNPLNTTLPVASVQVGWVMVPATGAVGVPGCEFINTLAEANEVHPIALVTV